MKKIFLIVGLGNPGKKYQNTPHNIGFEALILLKKELGFSPWQEKTKLKAKISRGKIDGKEIILAKPQTFMNNSGKAVQAIKNFYKIPLKNIWIIHDDLDLGLGKMRIKKDSSSGGHKGVESIISSLGTQNFNRIKIGIWDKTKERKNINTKTFVLKKFSEQEKIIIQEARQKAVSLLKNQISTSF
jgi:peptidyl-tRNA hydrolase, PTH1 family